uniref:ADP-ribosylation factor-like 16 n=1 Tax=Cyprinodon variegatus TaxID=28743 RepID=A0A3Q2DXK3_CYPVA
MSSKEVCLLLGATGVGKTLLLKRLQMITLHGSCEMGSPPSTLPTVGTNLTDLTLKKKKVTVREIGGCMGPIWPSYFQDCFAVIVCALYSCSIYFYISFFILYFIFNLFLYISYSSWWIQPTLFRYPPPVSSCCLCSLLTLCAMSLCLFSLTRGIYGISPDEQV